METLEYILGAVAIGAVFPIVHYVKDRTKICDYVRPEFLSLALTVGAAYLIAVLMNLEFTVKQLIVVSMAAANVSALTNGVKKYYQGSAQNNHSQPSRLGDQN